MTTSIRHGRQYDNGRGQAPATTASRENGDEPHRMRGNAAVQRSKIDRRMAEMGHRDRGRWSHTTLHVRFTPKADKYQIVSVGPLCAISGSEQSQQTNSLFDHPVGAAKQR
jgi:hypothetical protein